MHQPHDWREWRRLRALELSRKRWTESDIAEALGVSKGAVSQWLTAARVGGKKALFSHPHVGPRTKLTDAQKRLIPDFLWHGPEAYEFPGKAWTCPRVVEVLAREFGVTYHRDHVSRILKELGWTPQIPITRAIQRDESEIHRWRTTVWPKLCGQARRERRTLVFTDESGFYLLPGIVKSYSPKGSTPVIDDWATRDHLSVMGAVTPSGKLYTLVRQESFNGLHCIVFLDHLLRQTGGNLLVIWDGSPIHRRTEVNDFVAEVGPRRLRLERLPSYAPELNPVEATWQHLKNVELRNLACLDLEQLQLELHLAIGKLRRKPRLIHSFFAWAGLSLDKV